MEFRLFPRAADMIELGYRNILGVFGVIVVLSWSGCRSPSGTAGTDSPPSNFGLSYVPPQTEPDLGSSEKAPVRLASGGDGDKSDDSGPRQGNLLTRWFKDKDSDKPSAPRKALPLSKDASGKSADDLPVDEF